jgi:Uma2 family endonuclease
MVATPQTQPSQFIVPIITWEKLPDDYILPDDPVDNIYQPSIAEGLRDGLEIMGLASAQSLMSTNYGICTTVNGKIVVKAPDWAYVPTVTVPLSEVDRSYTPHLQGSIPVIVMEFLSETDGGEYSSKQTYPYGKWFFYEQILCVPNYVIFDQNGGLLEFYRLKQGKYVLEQPNSDGRHWIEEMALFLGTWQGQRAGRAGYWLRWWTEDGELLLWATERAEQERLRAEQAQAQAEQERLRAEQAQARADQLAAYLRSQGIDPEAIP